ncbi:hypothetical protein Pla52o_29890 [Novipirellula galeiformis]|uniref:Uncharacterized protein n=1 Tax=Novipirellula galeiformis TaxID=2528004 RepID=A0A5C6CEY5_9BACT|nr:hypothetical protein [Novipirellula galeiformis]TWU23453.1 hypothetical protein Pla52o_29890 [Novipirellula galeiformis]
MTSIEKVAAFAKTWSLPSGDGSDINDENALAEIEAGVEQGLSVESRR